MALLICIHRAGSPVKSLIETVFKHLSWIPSTDSYANQTRLKQFSASVFLMTLSSSNCCIWRIRCRLKTLTSDRWKILGAFFWDYLILISNNKIHGINRNTPGLISESDFARIYMTVFFTSSFLQDILFYLIGRMTKIKRAYLERGMVIKQLKSFESLKVRKKEIHLLFFNTDTKIVQNSLNKWILHGLAQNRWTV